MADSKMTENSTYTNWLVIIPARYASSRLPGKPLVDLGGLPLIIQVLKNLKPLEDMGVSLLVATDHDDIFKVVENHNYKALMTSPDHTNGTERCIEVANQSDKSFVLNVQGDEPFVNTDDLCNLMTTLEAKNDCEMATLIFKNDCLEDFNNPSKIKVVGTHEGHAMYFSRSPLPFFRDTSPDTFYQHVGVYAYKKDALLKYKTLAESPLEKAEMLEQLRPLQGGWKIALSEAKELAFGIDTEMDLQKARKKLEGL